MKLKSIFFVVFAMTLVACNESKHCGLQTISVDLDSREAIPLSEITQEVKNIRLELTDESLISDRIGRVLYSDDCLFVYDKGTPVPIMFDGEGKYIRSIGSEGQGPGEFIYMMDIAADFKNKHLYILTTTKLLVYDFEGNFLKDRRLDEIRPMRSLLSYITYADNSLKVIYEKNLSDPERRVCGMYSLDAQLEKKDSLHLLTCINPKKFFTHPYTDYITENAGKLFQYYFELDPEPFLRDTLFCIEGNHRVPHLRLNFGTSGVDMMGERTLKLYNIYRSERYVFAHLGGERLARKQMNYCHDLKTGKEYLMYKGFEDDIHHSGKVEIRPLSANSEMYYYFYQDENLDEDDNPVLCIGTLKK